MAEGAGTAQRRLQRPVIFVCDMQEKFRNAIWQFDKIDPIVTSLLTIGKVLEAGNYLDIPVFVTTQKAAKLGGTVEEITQRLKPLDAAGTVDKTRFSMWVPGISDNVLFEERAEVALMGIESHICITQTALDLLRAGHRVYVLADGVSSCNREEVPIALDRLRNEGAVVTTSESWLYECMGDAGIAQFRDIAKLVKQESVHTKAAMGALLGKM